MDNVVNLQTKTTFDDFWTACPKRAGKALCRVKWHHITNEGLHTRTLDRDSGQYVEIELQATPDELVEGMKRYKASLLKDGSNWELNCEARYVCHPATWLNQGRWEDYE